MRKGIAQLYQVTPEKTAISLEKMFEAVHLLEQMLQNNGGRYFVGHNLSLADISVASLFAPILSVPDTPWESIQTRTELLQKVYDDLLERPFGQWIMRVYAEERHAKGNWHGD
jgi:glutathione S-transferase